MANSRTASVIRPRHSSCEPCGAERLRLSFSPRSYSRPFGATTFFPSRVILSAILRRRPRIALADEWYAFFRHDAIFPHSFGLAVLFVGSGGHSLLRIDRRSLVRPNVFPHETPVVPSSSGRLRRKSGRARQPARIRSEQQTHRKDVERGREAESRIRFTGKNSEFDGRRDGDQQKFVIQMVNRPSIP